MATLPCIVRCPEHQWNLSVPLIEGDESSLLWAYCWVDDEGGDKCLMRCHDPIQVEGEDIEEVLRALWIVRALAKQGREGCYLPPPFAFPLAE